jgi:hypothetical protein
MKTGPEARVAKRQPSAGRAGITCEEEMSAVGAAPFLGSRVSAPPALGFKLTFYPALPGLGYVWPAWPPAVRSLRRFQIALPLAQEKQKASETSEASETKANYAFCTLPLFRQLAHTRTRRCDP